MAKMTKTENYNDKMSCGNVAAESATAAGVPDSKTFSLGEIALVSLVVGAVTTTLSFGADMLKDWIKSPAKPKEEKPAAK